MTFFRTKTGSASRVPSGSDRGWRGLIAATLATLSLAIFASAAHAQFSGSEGEGLPFDPFPRPGSGPSVATPNPSDNITIQIPGTGGTGQAAQVLNRVNRLGTRLTRASGACNQSSADVGRYLSCVSDALNSFSAELDRISSQLPPGMQNVARIVDRASADLSRQRADAARRLASAGSAAEREQIRRETIAAAAQTMNNAASDIRKSIGLIRASDPELANIQRETVFTIAQSVDNVGIQLSRAVGL